MQPSKPLRAFVFVLFLLSGACGLVYEIVWARVLTQVLGSTVLAIGTILAAFMAGLALGGWVLGRWGDRFRSPVLLYAVLEVGVGLTALVATLLMGSLTTLYVFLHGLTSHSDLLLSTLRFALAFFIVLPPTILMGATLPVLAKFVITRPSVVGVGLSGLYAINTVGALAGCLLAGFVLIGRFGIHRAVLIAVAGNLVIGALAWLASRRCADTSDVPAAGEPEREPEPPRSQPALSPMQSRTLLVGFALSGLASFAYEIFWTRSLVHLVGNSTYAFTTMLTAFLLGLAVGGYLVRFVLGRISRGVPAFAWLQILIGLSAAAAMPLLFFLVSSASLVRVFQNAYQQFAALAVLQFGAALLVMLVPATLIGATFPLIGSLIVRDLRRTGTDTGKVYAVNTVGNVLGALAPALVLLPVYGVQNGIALIAAMNVCVGLFLLGSTYRRWTLLRPLSLFAFVLAAVVLPRVEFGFQFPTLRQTERDRVLFYREGVSGTTKVLENIDVGGKRMSVDGVIIGGTERTDYKQQILAHFPKLLLEDYRSELSVGFGSGILAGESLRHSRLRRLVAVEIEPSVVEGATFFERENHHVASDDRLELVIDDVGNYLRTRDERFDIISADEKTAEKYASNGFSYSTDYYRLLGEHLNPRGLVIQWVPTSLPSRQYRMVLRTFASSFPEVCMWLFPPVGKGGGANTILVGSLRPLEVDATRMGSLLDGEAEVLRGIGKYGVVSPESILAHFVADRRSILSATEGTELNSSEHPYYEFYSPMDYAPTTAQRTLENLDLIQNLRRSSGFGELKRRLVAGPSARLEDAFRAEDVFLEGMRRSLESQSPSEVERHYEVALQIAPWNRNLRCQILTHYWRAGGTAYLEGDYLQARRLLGRGARVFPGIGQVHYNFGLALMKTGDRARALFEMRRASQLNPRLLGPHRYLASADRLAGDVKGAAKHFEAILAVVPEDVPANVGYALFLAEEINDLDGARRYFEKARETNPADPRVAAAQARLRGLGVGI